MKMTGQLPASAAFLVVTEDLQNCDIHNGERNLRVVCALTLISAMGVITREKHSFSEEKA